MITRSEKRCVVVEILFFTFMCWLLLSGCSVFQYTKGKAVKHATKVNYYWPEVMASFCNDNFIKTVYKDSISYIPGKPVYLPGPVRFIDCDSAKKANDKAGTPERTKRVACPPCVDTMRFVDTINRYRETIKENIADLTILQKKNSELERDNAVLKKDKKDWTSIAIWAIILGGVSVLAWIIKIAVKIIK